MYRNFKRRNQYHCGCTRHFPHLLLHSLFFFSHLFAGQAESPFMRRVLFIFGVGARQSVEHLSLLLVFYLVTDLYFNTMNFAEKWP